MGNSEKLDKLFFNNKYFNCFYRFAQKNNASDQYQCPEWGDLHFYTDATYLAEHQNMCQCPKWGDLHFYDKMDTREEFVGKLCQCPERGDLHFYAKKSTITR